MNDMEALRIVFKWHPWGRDKISRRVARYLDGDQHALDGAPTIRAELDAASDHVAQAARRYRVEQSATRVVALAVWR